MHQHRPPDLRQRLPVGLGTHISGALAQLLRSEELFVAWSDEGGAGEPVIPARLHEPDARPVRPERRPNLIERLLGIRR